MRKADAPPAGWYPDPEHSIRLRWWDGLDWTDIRRAPPSDAELIVAEENREFFETSQPVRLPSSAPVASGYSRQDTHDIVAEVRSAARQEIDRAAQEFSDRASTAVRSVTPLITDYASELRKWVRWAVVIAITLLVAYFVFQVIAQASFFDWLGDRIDNVTDESGSTPLHTARSAVLPTR